MTVPVTVAQLLPLVLGLPFAGLLALPFLGRIKILGELGMLALGGALLGTVVTIVAAVARHDSLTLVLFDILPGIPLIFIAEPLGTLFALLASALFLVNGVFAIGYARSTGLRHQIRFHTLFVFAIASTMIIAFAGNLVTLFVGYELLTLCTYPLVTHDGSDEARRAGRTYLGILLGTSIGLFFVAIIWTYVIAGRLDFVKGGILGSIGDERLLPVLFGLFVFGAAKAALMPVHRWLPAAMVAPTPVSALLHAVAVVKAGVFVILKISVYIFGLDLLQRTGASTWLLWVAGFTVIAGGVIALTKDDLKARLAYSTVSQLAYVSLAAALATPLGIVAGVFQMISHAVAKITLFMCAGAIYVKTHERNISKFDGLGRAMPYTFGAFLVASLALAGLPPSLNFWTKWQLLIAGNEVQSALVFGIVILGSLLALGYLVPVAARAFFRPAATPQKFAEAPLLCVLPLLVTALATIGLFALREPLIKFLSPVLQ